MWDPYKTTMSVNNGRHHKTVFLCYKGECVEEVFIVSNFAIILQYVLDNLAKGIKLAQGEMQPLKNINSPGTCTEKEK